MSLVTEVISVIVEGVLEDVDEGVVEDVDEVQSRLVLIFLSCLLHTHLFHTSQFDVGDEVQTVRVRVRIPLPPLQVCSKPCSKSKIIHALCLHSLKLR